MSEKLNWLFQLDDALSGTSKKMEAALAGVEREIDKVDKALKDLEREQRKKALEKATDPVKRQRLELQLQRDKLLLSRDATRDAASETKKLSDVMGLSAFKGTIWGAVITKGIDLAIGLATGIARAVMGLGELAAGFGRAGLEAASFRRQMRLGFEISTGSKKSAAFEMMDARILSEGLSASGDETQKRYLSLLQGGFSGKETHVLLQAVEDMAAGGQGDKADNIVLAIKQIRAKGRLQAEELVSQLADAGLNIGTVYEKIGKLMKTDAKSAMKAISQGKVSSELGIYAIVDTIRETFSKDGIIGQTAKDMADDSVKLLGMLEDRPRTLMEGLEGNKGIQAFSGFLQNLLKATDPDGPTGKRIVGRLNDIFERAGTALFGDLSTQQGYAKIEAFLDTAIGLVDRLVAGTRIFYDFMAGFAEGMGLGQIYEESSALFNGPLDEKKIADISAAFRDLGDNLGKLITPLVRMVELGGKLTDMLSMDGNYGDFLGRVFQEVTVQAHEPGFALERVTAGFHRLLPQTSAAGTNNHVEVGGIHVTMGPGADAEAVAARLREVVPSVIADALERMATEQGAM